MSESINFNLQIIKGELDKAIDNSCSVDIRITEASGIIDSVFTTTITEALIRDDLKHLSISGPGLNLMFDYENCELGNHSSDYFKFYFYSEKGITLTFNVKL